ncbi:MAG: hypothetical protein J6C19_12960 [Lachnospiraceae bacterium]|nr:hypothetical protein [Lachnospiraceae bacterium]MBO5146421.1 hypothetical protein [Lachnospiraceae bacterium]
MKEKVRHRFCQIVNAVILAGIIILFIGLYYWVVKAGIPYQDPPIELQIQYAINMGIGDILVGKGFVIAVSGGIARVLLGLIWKKREKK